jgi:hypothetical protein
MKLLPEGFKALLAPAAMLPASLPRPTRCQWCLPSLYDAGSTGRKRWIDRGRRNECSKDRCDDGSSHCYLLVCLAWRSERKICFFSSNDFQATPTFP